MNFFEKLKPFFQIFLSLAFFFPRIKQNHCIAAGFSRFFFNPFFRRISKPMLLQGFRRREHSRSSASEELIWMLFWICPLMSLSSSCPLVLAEGNRSDTVALYSCILVLLTMGFIYLFIVCMLMKYQVSTWFEAQADGIDQETAQSSKFYLHFSCILLIACPHWSLINRWLYAGGICKCLPGCPNLRINREICCLHSVSEFVFWLQLPCFLSLLELL